MSMITDGSGNYLPQIVFSADSLEGGVLQSEEPYIFSLVFSYKGKEWPQLDFSIAVPDRCLDSYRDITTDCIEAYDNDQLVLVYETGTFITAT